MRTGVRLGVDVGDVRIGVAVCDAAGLVATPVETVPADSGSVARLATLAAERAILEMVVGLPRSLSGAEGPAARKIRAYAERLAREVHPLPVRLVDERLTTRSAERALAALGWRGAKRRAVIDQAAAVEILQSALDAERLSGTPPGEELDVRMT